MTISQAAVLLEKWQGVFVITLNRPRTGNAIDDEIANTRSTLNEKNKLKIEALYTVKQVLVNQKKRQPAAVPEKGLSKSANVA